MIRRLGSVLALIVLAVGCSSPRPGPPTAAPDLGRTLAGKVTADGMFVHLRVLQDIANANKGNRAEGTPGYDASVDYVAKTLRSKGFEVATPQFDRLYAVAPGKPSLTIAGGTYSVDQASLLVRTPPGGLSGQPVRPARQPSGCAPDDYLSALPAGAIAVVDDARCSVVDKQNSARAKGAAALIVVSTPTGRGAPPTLFTPGYYKQLTLPVAVVGSSGGSALAHATAPVRLVLDAENIKITSRNVLAQTKTGSTDDVIWSVHISTARAAVRVSTTTDPGSPWCWKPHCNWARWRR